MHDLRMIMIGARCRIILADASTPDEPFYAKLRQLYGRHALLTVDIIDVLAKQLDGRYMGACTLALGDLWAFRAGTTPDQPESCPGDNKGVLGRRQYCRHPQKMRVSPLPTNV
ncbi:hypothetical protein DQ353_15380 [Arthrobacter sp. AQ5-05]|uniref:hypothetical protein n=1 Tax=Arthrobacter sp. AQ5-05 TaxID=2184581 RepID=UPI000DCDF312|nr:hypothetical protein [Arthrobacter sp. AQ5-05]RAX48452.1 hypothetical protein DQ353_15380 [Arthrobacter sp. AQ5-05]